MKNTTEAEVLAHAYTRAVHAHAIAAQDARAAAHVATQAAQTVETIAAAIKKTRAPSMKPPTTPTPTEHAHAASLELIAAQQTLEALRSGPVENADSLAWCHKYTATLAEVNRARAAWFDALAAMD